MQNASYSAMDATGTTITLSAPARRIVCTASPGVDMLASLGLTPLGILKDGGAETAAHPRFFGEQTHEIAQIGGSYFAPDCSDIAALQPDLVIGWAGDQANLREELVGIPVFYAYTVQIGRAIGDVRSLGVLTDRAAEAEAAVQRFEQRLTLYQSHITQPMTVAALLDGSDALELMTEQTLLGNLLAQVTNYPFPLPAGVSHYGGCILYSLDDLAQHDPDVIVTITASWVERTEPLNQRLVANPLWNSLRAVTRGRVYEVPAVWASTGGVLGMRVLLDEALPLIYPETFSQALPE